MPSPSCPLDPSAETRRNVLAAYDDLEPFPDAAEALGRLVSSNAWDVAGAGAADRETAWVNRRNDPPEELGAEPGIEVPSLAELADALA